MLAEWKTLDTQNNTLIIDFPDKDLDDHERRLLKGHSYEGGTGHSLV
jgi:hypothetical protein